MREVVIVSAVRTPIGSYRGSLRSIPAYELAALVLNEAVKRAKVDPASVDDVVMAQAYQSGEYVNIARMGLLTAGWPEEVTGITVDRRCCGGLDAICFSAMEIQSENADIVVAGGVESMSTAEFYLQGSVRWGIGGEGDMPRGHGSLATWGIPMYDRLQRCRVMSQPIARYGVLPSMMSWAETAAQEEGITREECDKWALRSHQKACAAIDRGIFREEIVPVKIPQKKGAPKIVDTDEPPRRDTALESLANLRPILGGVCTAGNSSTENDGAAACVVITPEKAKGLGVEPMAYLRAFAVAGTDPTRTYRGVPAAVNKALRKAGLRLDEIDLIEIQEAFAAQVLADLKYLKLPEAHWEKVNVNGSGISLGHPIGATGTMRMVTLLHEMKRRDAKYGLEAICGGGGLAICAIVERK
jgi:acetyl-CoA C-acetyltransferase